MPATATPPPTPISIWPLPSTMPTKTLLPSNTATLPGATPVKVKLTNVGLEPGPRLWGASTLSRWQLVVTVSVDDVSSVWPGALPVQPPKKVPLARATPLSSLLPSK